MSRDTRISTIYQSGWAPLMGLLISMGGSRSDAEEVAQSAYEKLIRTWPKVSQYADPQAWVRKVAVRELIDRHRRADVADRKRVAVERPGWTSSHVSEVEEQMDLRAAMAELSVEHRAVLLLHHVEDLSVAEVAKLLGISDGTVKSRLSRARAQLNKHLDKTFGEQR